ncbi:glutathione S-transferase 1 isoform X3 [Citrus sinensis]|uniref:glutathione S-transferase 1 isoform X3 n=1 Tax=Citrus sinensis TaxID=2711 RepID=UPI0022780161|nr:glutathione S-transferase 1 isoform X3 [Citrus sinensis]
MNTKPWTFQKGNNLVPVNISMIIIIIISFFKSFLFIFISQVLCHAMKISNTIMYVIFLSPKKKKSKKKILYVMSFLIYWFPEFEELNPLHFVPVLVDGDVVVSDSYAILLYLEEKYPQRALLPAADPQQRALNLQAASIISSSMQPLHMLSLLKYIEDKFGPDERLLWVQTHIEKGFLALEKLLIDFAAKYATGEDVLMCFWPHKLLLLL